MKNYSEIAIVMTVRKNSTRCKNKLLRNFAGTTLFDIALQKLSKMEGFDIFVGAYEKEFIVKISEHPRINLIKRSKESVNLSGYEKNASTKLFEMYNKIDHKWLFWINPCHAFLKLDTIKNAIKEFSEIISIVKINIEPIFGCKINDFVNSFCLTKSIPRNPLVNSPQHKMASGTLLETISPHLLVNATVEKITL